MLGEKSDFTLHRRYDLYILSTAPWGNPSAWTDKLEWIKKHFDSDRPEGTFYKRLILTHHKNLCIHGISRLGGM